jgi:hypothetical protein
MFFVTLKLQGKPETLIEVRLMVENLVDTSDQAHGCNWCKRTPPLWGMAFTPCWGISF